MRGNRSRDTKPEMALRDALRGAGLDPSDGAWWSGRLPGSPDAVLEGVAVFADGDYWHRCPAHFRPPRTNADFWRAKFERNAQRDRRDEHELLTAEIVPVRVWECEIRRRAARAAREIAGLAGALRSGEVTLSDLAWAAGFIDGNGAVTITKSGAGMTPYVTVGSRHSESLQRLAGIFGVGKVGRRASSRAEISKWQVSGSVRVPMVLRWIKCFLVAKRLNADLVMAWSATVQTDHSRVPVPAAVLRERERVAQMVRMNVGRRRHRDG